MVFTVSITIKKKIEGTSSDVAPLDQDITTKTVNGLAGSIIGIKPSVILLLLITSSEV